jgi:hypothetical protein
MGETTEEYIQKLRENTATNMMKKRERQEKVHEMRLQKLVTSMNALEGYVTTICKTKMMDASDYGHIFTRVMEFTNFDMFDEDYKFVFLMKGPIRNRNSSGVTYFKEHNIIPLLDRLNESMQPIKFTLRFDKAKQSHTLYANWYDLYEESNNT